jgi:hypothetical protein
MMTKIDQQKETCPCRTCRSDLAYILPCDYRDVIEFEVITVEGGEYEFFDPAYPTEAEA